jgi:hypothetical protein
VCAFGKAIENLQPLEPKFTWVKFVSAIMPIGPTIKQYYTVAISTSCTHVQMRNLFNISEVEHYPPVHTESESFCCKLIGIGMYWPYLQFDDSPGHHLMEGNRRTESGTVAMGWLNLKMLLFPRLARESFKPWKFRI